MKPLLAHVYEPHRVTYPCYVQPKLNGVRALYQNGCFQSRDELPWSAGILDHISRELVDVVDSRTILDGELYVHGWPLQRINGAVTPIRQSQRVDTSLVEYHVFDKVDFSRSFEERWNSLPHGISLSRVSFVETVHVSTHLEANTRYAQWVADGYEGMMYRLGDCPYTTPRQETVSINRRHPGGGYSCEDGIRPPGRLKFWSDQDNRCWHLLKRKSWQDGEFLCVGVEEGEGKYKGMVGALVCKIPRPIGAPIPFPANPKIIRLFTVGSGLSDADRIHYFNNPPIDRMIKVQYLCLSSDGIPLNPTILAIL